MMARMPFLLAVTLLIGPCLATDASIVNVDACDMKNSVGLPKLDLGGVLKVQLNGVKAKVKRTKLPAGSAPRVTVKTNRPQATLPVTSVVNGKLIIQSPVCKPKVQPIAQTPLGAISAAGRLGGSSLGVLSRWLVTFAPLALHRSTGGAPTALLLAFGTWTMAKAEPEAEQPTCEDDLEIEIAVPEEGADLSTPEARMEALRALKEASERAAPDPKDNGAEGYSVDPNNFRLYVNGQHRRPTDPATAEEIIAAQKLLFGARGQVTSLKAAADIAALPEGWAAATSALANVGGVDPAAISGVSQIPSEAGDPTNAQAQKDFLDYAKVHGFNSAYAWLKETAQAPLRRNLRWWGINQIASATPDRKHVIAVEDAIEAGKKDYDMQRIIFVRMSGGQMALTEDNTKLWGAELHIAVDVSDLKKPFIVPDRIEVYSRLNSAPGPPASPVENMDQLYLKTVAMALYGNDHTGAFRKLVLTYNGSPNNRNGGSAGGSKAMAMPFEWLDGDKAEIIGKKSDEHLYVAALGELAPSVVPWDGHQISAGTFMFPPPLTMVYGVHNNGTRKQPDARNTLPNTNVGALTFFGRGLTFSAADAQSLHAAVNVDDLTKSDFATIAAIAARSIAQAWGSDEASPGSKFRPGVLAKRSDGISIPAVVLKHSYDVPTYVNHATSKALDGLLLDPKAKHRDARDNLDHMAPPEDAKGTPLYKPNGKPRSTVQPSGESFTIDGYSVTYVAAMTWKFLIGLDPDAGLTIYHIRVVLPPSRAHPNGQEIPYLYRAYSPNFGTDYSTSNLGNPYSYQFFESHYGDMGSVHKPSTCSGATLPMWRSKGGAYFEPSAVYYSTYGQEPPVWDPFSAELGHKAPMQAYPTQHFMVEKGLFAHAVCVQEADLGHSMWHMYSAQHLRGLSVVQSTVSDAYNVLQKFTFQSDGKIKVGSSAHGKPAIGQHGIPGTGGQHASDGKGGFSENHLHWFVLALEPQLKLDLPDVENKLMVSDLIPPDEEPEDWFGMSFHRRAEVIANSTETDKLRYQQSRQRRWRLAAINKTTGEELGGLRISSNQFGFWIKPGNKAHHFKPEDTYAGSHWWLGQDLYVVNSTGRRDSTVLVASSTKPGYDPHHATHHPLWDSPKYDNPVVFCQVKLPHEVIAEELPVQSGFTHLEVTVEPQNLLGFNPLLLSRYQPDWNELMENTWMNSYEAPYKSEYGEPR